MIPPALTRLSDDEFFELYQANPALHCARNARQEIIIMPPAGSESSESSGEVYGQLSSDSPADLQAKMEIYLANGVLLDFLLDAAAEAAYVYRPGQPVETVQGYDRELRGEQVLPGFQLDLRRAA